MNLTTTAIKISYRLGKKNVNKPRLITAKFKSRLKDKKIISTVCISNGRFNF